MNRSRTIKYIEDMLTQLDDRRLNIVYVFILHLIKK